MNWSSLALLFRRPCLRICACNRAKIVWCCQLWNMVRTVMWKSMRAYLRACHMRAVRDFTVWSVVGDRLGFGNVQGTTVWVLVPLYDNYQDGSGYMAHGGWEYSSGPPVRTGARWRCHYRVSEVLKELLRTACHLGRPSNNGLCQGPWCSPMRPKRQSTTADICFQRIWEDFMKTKSILVWWVPCRKMGMYFCRQWTATKERSRIIC